MKKSILTILLLNCTVFRKLFGFLMFKFIKINCLPCFSGGSMSEQTNTIEASGSTDEYSHEIVRGYAFYPNLGYDGSNKLCALIERVKREVITGIEVLVGLEDHRSENQHSRLPVTYDLMFCYTVTTNRNVHVINEHIAILYRDRAFEEPRIMHQERADEEIRHQLAERLRLFVPLNIPMSVQYKLPHNTTQRNISHEEVNNMLGTGYFSPAVFSSVC